MSEVNYRHTARVKADSWFIRFYCWLWEADVERVDFCRLFWGYLFAVPNLVVRAVGYLPYKLFRFVADRTQDRRDSWRITPAEEIRIRAEARTRRTNRKRRFEGFFAKVGSWADAAIGRFQSAWPVLKYPVTAAGAIAGAALVTLLGYGLYLLGALIVANLAVVTNAALFALAVALGTAVAMLLLLTVVWFFSDTSAGASVRSGTKDGFLTFGGAIRSGFHGIKGRTCPKIELVDEGVSA